MSANQTAADTQIEEGLASSDSPSLVATEPHPGEAFVDFLSRFVAATLSDRQWRCFLHGNEVAAQILAGNGHMLPAILWQAEKNHQLLLGSPMGVSFIADPTAAVGARALVEPAGGRGRSNFLVQTLEVLCHSLENFTLDAGDLPVAASDVRENILLGRRAPPRGTACTLDHLAQGFLQDHELGLVPWSPDSQPRSPQIG